MHSCTALPYWLNVPVYTNRCGSVKKKVDFFCHIVATKPSKMNFRKGVALLSIWIGSTMLVTAQSNALNFDGINDHILTTFQGPSGNQARSVEAWIRTTAIADPNAGGFQNVIMDWGNMATGARFTFNLWFFNGLRIEVQGSGLSSTRPLNDGLWHHVAAVYNPALTTDQFKLFVDGLLDTAGNLSTAVNTSTMNFLRIGHRLDGLNHFNGDIDEIRCWNVALSDSDILSSYNREFCNLPAGLAAYYTLNTGVAGGSNWSETTAFDRVANNHGTLQNFELIGGTSNWVVGVINNPTSLDTQQITACKTYTSIGGTVLNVSGTVMDTLISSVGCDSVVRQEVVIQNVNTSISLTHNTLSAQSTLASTYQWLDCDNGFSPIVGANQSEFTPSRNGNYAVALTEEGCTDTTGCLLVTNVSVRDLLPKLQLQLYPNPTDGFVTMHAEMLPQAGRWQIKDVQGRLVKEGILTSGTSIQLDLSELSAGQYILQVFAERHAPTHVILVKR